MVDASLLNARLIKGDNTFIASHKTSFLDKNFHDKFLDPSLNQRPVEAKAIDAGWIFKQPEGQEFLHALSESDNIDLFGLDTIQYLVKYQWRQFKPRIIKYLFYPFLAQFLLFNIFALYLFDISLEN